MALGERYAAQPEILADANHVADRFDLRHDIQFKTRVTRATWGERKGRWLVETDKGDRVSARFLVMATGCLSAARLPHMSGRRCRALDDLLSAPHGDRHCTRTCHAERY